MAQIDPAALEELAVFPLPNAVLFPSAVLPLHIFEPRYREMTRDALASSRLIAVARLRPGFEADYEGRPPVYSVAGVGEIIDDREHPDGRFHILLRGVGRVDISDELPPDRSYRRARAVLLDGDHTSRPALLKPCADQLFAMCERVADALGEDGSKLRELLGTIETSSECADILSAALIGEPDTRQKLLETLDPADRLDQLLSLVGQIVASMTPAPETLN